VEHLGSHSIYHCEGHFGAIVRRIDMHPKGTLAEWHVDDLGDRIPDRSDIGIGWYDDRERRLRFRFPTGPTRERS
jgi:hypothetical protein